VQNETRKGGRLRKKGENLPKKNEKLDPINIRGIGAPSPTRIQICQENEGQNVRRERSSIEVGKRRTSFAEDSIERKTKTAETRWKVGFGEVSLKWLDWESADEKRGKAQQTGDWRRAGDRYRKKGPVNRPALHWRKNENNFVGKKKKLD